MSAPVANAPAADRVALRCPACETGEAAPEPLLEGPDRLIGAPGSFAVVRCEACGLAFTAPRLREQDFATYYPESYSAYAPGTRLNGRMGLVDRLRLEAVARYGPFRRIWRRGPCRLLDVGCGTGNLAAVFACHGFDVAGLEPSPTAAEHARRFGVPVHVGTLESAPWPEASFDAIIFNHSLEHISDPSGAVAAALRLLRPGGTITIAVPNFGSWHRRAFGSAWFQLDLPRHLQHFDRASLVLMLREAGLRPVSVYAASMRPSLLGSLQYLAFGRLRYKGRAFRFLGWALLPLLGLSDRLGEGDCLHVVAER